MAATDFSAATPTQVKAFVRTRRARTREQHRRLSLRWRLLLVVIALIALLGLLSEGNGRSFSRFFNEISNVHDMASADASEAAPAQPGPAPPRAADLQDLGDDEKGNNFGLVVSGMITSVKL